mgnify:CR=1 FL=1
MALAIFLGLPIAMARLWGPRPVQWLAIAYVEFFRGIPVLLLIFFLYYGLPTVGLKLNAMTAAIERMPAALRRGEDGEVAMTESARTIEVQAASS